MPGLGQGPRAETLGKPEVGLAENEERRGNHGRGPVIAAEPLEPLEYARVRSDDQQRVESVEIGLRTHGVRPGGRDLYPIGHRAHELALTARGRGGGHHETHPGEPVSPLGKSYGGLRDRNVRGENHIFGEEFDHSLSLPRTTDILSLTGACAAWSAGHMRSPVPLVAAALLALTLTGCGAAAAPATSTAGFPSQTRADYQLGGAYDPPARVGIVARDSTEPAATDAWSICYVNGFQTQPGEAERWPADLLLADADGPLVDPAWPDEFILDTGSDATRERIAAIIDTDLRRCADADFDAVEIDNLDTFSRFPALNLDGALDLAERYADRAHELGLLIGQKNAAEWAPQLHAEVGFDFAVAEECVSFGECAAFTDVYGDAVIDVEYADDPTVTATSVCADPERPFATTYRDRDLVPVGSPGYVFAAC